MYFPENDSYNVLTAKTLLTEDTFILEGNLLI